MKEMMRKKMKLQIDLSQSGLAMIFKPYQVEAMKMLWKDPTSSYGSREVWSHLNKVLIAKEQSSVSRNFRISRASVINFLNDMVDEGFLDFYEMTGKGGHRRIYNAKLDEKQFWTKIIEATVEKLEEASGSRVSIYVPASPLFS